MAAIKTTVIKDTGSVSICQDSVTMTTTENKHTSCFSEENCPRDNVDNVTESEAVMSTKSSCQNFVAIATVDNQSKSDVREENEKDKLVSNFSNSQVVTDTDSVIACKDLTTATTMKTGLELQDTEENVHNLKNSQEVLEVESVHVGQDSVNTVTIVRTEPESHDLGKNDADIATDIYLENIDHIEDSVSMVTVKTEPISDDSEDNHSKDEVHNLNSQTDPPQPIHIQVDLIVEDSRKLEHRRGGDLEDSVGGNLMSYRDDSGGESDAESSCSSTIVTSSSESSDVEESKELNTETKINRLADMDDDIDEKKVKRNKFGLEDIRTRGEMSLDELPPIEDLHITVDEKVKLLQVGQVSSVIGCLVVVQSNQQIAPLNEDTVLFLEDRTSIGQVFEIFGPVVSPWYSFRFNSTADVENKGIKVGTPIFCAPEEENFTKYVFVNALRQLKGSDASWESNNEPPEWIREFSDDEEEKRAKQKKRNKNRSTEEGTENTAQTPENKKKRNRQMEKRPGNTTMMADSDSREFARCQEWPPRDGGPKQGYKYSDLLDESQVNPFQSVPEQRHQERNQHWHFAQRNRSNQWRPETRDIRTPGFQFGGSPSFPSRFNQPFSSDSSNKCPTEFQMRGPQNDFSNIRDPHQRGPMHRIGNNLDSPPVGQNHPARMGMFGQNQPPRMGNFRPNQSHIGHRFPPQSGMQPQRNQFSLKQQSPLFMDPNQPPVPIGQPPFGGNRFQDEVQGPDLKNNRQMHQGTNQSYPSSNAGPQFTGPSPDRPLLGMDRNTYQQPFCNPGQFSINFGASRNFSNQMNHSVEQLPHREQNYQTGNADNHSFGGHLRGHLFNQPPPGKIVDSRLIYNKDTF